VKFSAGALAMTVAASGTPVGGSGGLVIVADGAP
jgi:hypothetical protein